MWEKHQSEWMGIIPFYKGLNRVIKFIYGGPNIIYFLQKPLSGMTTAPN